MLHHESIARHLDEEMDCQAAVAMDDTKGLCYHLAPEGEQKVPGVFNKNKNDI